MSKRSKHNQHGFGVVEILLVVLALCVVGFGAYFVIKRQNTSKTVTNSDANKTTPSADISNKTKTPAADTKKNDTATVAPNRGTYSLQAPESTTKIYDTVDDKTTGKPGDSSSVYVSVTHPMNWEVYKKPRYQEPSDPEAALYIKSPSGHYFHMSAGTGGSGGDCQPNEGPYTLSKKLPTQDSNLFFTEYSVAGNAAYSNIGLESFSAKDRYDFGNPASLNKHFLLKEGQTNTNLCNLSYYQKPVGFIKVSVRNNNVDELASNLKWSDIKDDTEFVAMIQSLTVHK